MLLYLLDINNLDRGGYAQEQGLVGLLFRLRKIDKPGFLEILEYYT